MSQGGFTQYLNGTIPINPVFLAQFCELIQVDPNSIDPAMAKLITINKNQDDEGQEFLKGFKKLSDEDRKYIQSLIDRLGANQETQD